MILPRVGQIKIGMKNANGYPQSVDYFIPTGKYAGLFTQAYGEKPQTIQIVFPDDDPAKVCNERYEYRDADGRFTGAEPAGELYLLAAPAPETPTRGKAARSMEYKLDGLVRDEQKVFDAMDAEETGRYLPFSFRNGVPSPYQKEKRADKAKLSRIQLHLVDLVTQMGEQLYGGCIAAEPLVTGRSPCRWCDYGFICCHEEGIGERALDAPAKPFEPEEKKEEDQ